MKIREKYLWLGAILIAIAFTYQEHLEKDNLSFLIKTYEAESQIQDRQVSDLASQMLLTQAEEYNRGFEAGKTQAAIALMNNESLMDYADGYHAALEQFGSDVAYDHEIEEALKSINKDWEEIENDYLEIIELLTDSYSKELDQVVPVATTEE